MTSIGKRLLLFSPHDQTAGGLVEACGPWRCRVQVCATVEELKGAIEGGEFDFVVVEDSKSLRALVSDDDGSRLLETPLAELEKRHIMRVLASTGGNKTRASKILGIDTKTLYNKLKTYSAAAQSARKRGPEAAAGES